MPDFNESLKAASLAVLRRELSEEERAEFLDLAAALGMNAVEDYLYILMIFKRQSDALGQRFDEISELERKIHGTLEHSIDRILGEGAREIASEMGDEIADHARNAFSVIGGYHMLKGQILVACAICGSAILGYFLGWHDILRRIPTPDNRVLQTLLYFPAGWCFLLCGATYTFLWIGDNWYEIKRMKWYKALLGGQILGLLLLLLLLI